MPRNKMEIETITNRIIIDENDCWLWQGALNKQGYGIITIDYKAWRVHKLMYILTYGEFDNQLVVRHKPDICNNPTCCNPNHLIIGTRKQNTDDKQIAGTMKRGESHGRAKLTESDVLQIREDFKNRINTLDEFCKEQSPIYGVGESAINKICYNKTWNHLNYD